MPEKQNGYFQRALTGGGPLLEVVAMRELTVLNNNYSFRVAASHNGFQTSLTLSKTRFFCRKVNVPFGGVDFVYRQLQSQNPSGKSYPVRMEMPMRYVSIHAVR